MVTTTAQSASQVQSALRQSPIPALRKLSVRETDEAVTLLGRVASYYIKQLAQETVMGFLSNRELHNEIIVVP
ncbi:MAG: BON domain-containing protein [Gemmataceae bacterium]